MMLYPSRLGLREGPDNLDLVAVETDLERLGEPVPRHAAGEPGCQLGLVDRHGLGCRPATPPAATSAASASGDPRLGSHAPSSGCTHHWMLLPARILLLARAL